MPVRFLEPVVPVSPYKTLVAPTPAENHPGNLNRGLASDPH